LALHSILDLLKDEADKPLVLISAAEEKETWNSWRRKSAEGKELKEEFISQTLPTALGYDASLFCRPKDFNCWSTSTKGSTSIFCCICTFPVVCFPSF
jgi:hypothetical protein